MTLDNHRKLKAALEHLDTGAGAAAAQTLIREVLESEPSRNPFTARWKPDEEEKPAVWRKDPNCTACNSQGLALVDQEDFYGNSVYGYCPCRSPLTI